MLGQYSKIIEYDPMFTRWLQSISLDDGQFGNLGMDPRMRLLYVETNVMARQMMWECNVADAPYSKMRDFVSVGDMDNRIAFGSVSKFRCKIASLRAIALVCSAFRTLRGRS